MTCLRTISRLAARASSTPALVAWVALTFASVFVLVTLAAHDWNPTVFLAVGRDAPTSKYVSSLLGGDIDVRPRGGHDGQHFFAQANDPFLLEPSVHAAVLDRPVYRSQRMLFPLIAGGFGLFSPWTVVWSMLVLSVLTFALGTFATALVSQGMGGSPWWGLAFGLNIGVVNELLVGGTGHLGLALMMLSIAALQRNHPGWSIVALTGAVLVREVFLVAALGLAWWLGRAGAKRAGSLHVAVPAAAALSWGLYVRWRIGWESGVREIEEIGLPLQGLIGAARLWPDSPTDLAVGIVVVVLLVLFLRRFLTSDWMVGYATVGFGLITVLLTSQVWFSYFDITRAISPVITAFVLMAFASRGENTEPRDLGVVRDG